MIWRPSKLGTLVLLFGASFAVCEVYGTFLYFRAQQGAIDYIVLMGCGIAAGVALIPPLADIAKRRKWHGLRALMWLAMPLAMLVVIFAGLQRTGLSTDTAEQARADSGIKRADAQRRKT